MNEVLRYKNRGFTVNIVLSDAEFSSVKQSLQNTGIRLNATSASEHVGEIERFFRFLKERIRALASTLPFSKYPKVLKLAMLKYATFWINALPRKSGVSNDLGPGTIIDGIEPDFNLHCKVPLGTYCQVHEEDVPTNTNSPRTIGAICLGPSGNLQGGYDFLSLSTGRIVKCGAFTGFSMPTEVVDLVD